MARLERILSINSIEEDNVAELLNCVYDALHRISGEVVEQPNKKHTTISINNSKSNEKIIDASSNIHNQLININDLLD